MNAKNVWKDLLNLVLEQQGSFYSLLKTALILVFIRNILNDNYHTNQGLA